MAEEDPAENPYAAPTVEPEAERSLSKPITALMFFFHLLVACFAFFIFWSLIGGLLTFVLQRHLLSYVAATLVQLCAAGISLLLAKYYLPPSMFRRKDR